MLSKLTGGEGAACVKTLRQTPGTGRQDSVSGREEARLAFPHPGVPGESEGDILCSSDVTNCSIEGLPLIAPGTTLVLGLFRANQQWCPLLHHRLRSAKQTTATPSQHLQFRARSPRGSSYWTDPHCLAPSTVTRHSTDKYNSTREPPENDHGESWGHQQQPIQVGRAPGALWML
jgi:hypothetical protein